MTAGEKASLDGLTAKPSIAPVSSEKIGEQAVTWAEQHLFERRSIVHEHELWRHALEHARGENVSLAEIQAVTQKRGYLRFDHHPGQVTTREHIEREMEIIQTAREGIGECHPLVWQPTPFNPMMQWPQLPSAWSLDTPSGLAALNGEVTRQAATIAYLNDFQFMMWVTLAAIPLLFLLRRPGGQRRGPAPSAAAAALE